MLAREAFSRPRLERQPEPTAEMAEVDNVLAFHEQGAGPLLPIYHFNALAASRLLRPGGTVLDLGSGSGQYLSYLARLRPDIRIIGLEMSGTMVSVGQRFLAEAGLDGRVELRIGDMTSFAAQTLDEIDIVTSIFALHHLPALGDLTQCFNEIGLLRKRAKCAVWLFDHTRPRHPKTPEIFPEIFTPEAPAEFRADSCNSLRASFSFAELSAALDSSTIGAMEHQCARLMRFYQVHWTASPASRNPLEEGVRLAGVMDLPTQTKAQFEGLRTLFPGVPLDQIK